ncbi:hypothetical protein GOP47_0017479 [Adiantum capillus-veneris]|uniref:CCR4-NOT transcription complex subunit 10 n=1 Tax=Adiantum capillus-veneris TaxID=13818 RepID=A0A9D4UFE5_ADICA|nr:hypothetical protein GOP47_0017479 [Adiantum capillus-veneris]
MEALDTGSSTAAASSTVTATSSTSPSLSSSSAAVATVSSASSSASVGAPLSSSSSDVNFRSPSFNAVLARDASSLFHSSRYQECLDLLHQILLSDHENPKVIHNIAVVEYFRDGCSDPQRLLELLSKVKKKIEELCKKSVRDQWDDANVSPTNSSPNANNSNLKGGSLGTVDIPAYLEDYDTSIPIFNSAVILFHLQQYAVALTVLEPLYHNIEVIDEPAALRICGLMLDTALAASQPRKACDVLRYMERVFGLGILVTPSETGNSIPSHSMLLSSTLDSTSSMGTAGAAVCSVNNAASEASLTRSSSEEVLDEEVLSLGLDMEGSNTAKSATPISLLSHAVPGPDRVSSAPPRDSSIKIFLHLNKVRFFLCTRNIRAAKKEVKLAMNLAQGVDQSKALMLKAQLEYLRGNHRKAIKLLMTCNSKEPGLRCMFLNNLGCIHHHLRKDSTAYTYFHKALKNCISAISAKPLLLSTYSQDKSLSILYNCGLQQLRIGNPVLAAQCFQEAGSFCCKQPLLWLRIAECCISALEKGLLETGGFDNSIKKDELRVSSVGEGRWRRLVLPAGSLNPSLSNIAAGFNLEDDKTMGNSSSAKGLEPAAFGKPHKLSLLFARQCLHNALLLVNQLLARDAKGAVETRAVEVEEALSEDLKSLSLQSLRGGGLPLGAQSNPNGNNKEGKVNSLSAILASVTAFEEEQQKRNSTILQYVLADLAFVELCLDNPVRALKNARQLLQHPECSKPFKFLGHVYAAEALCLLNRPHEAVAELSTCINECNSLETPANGGDEDGQKWKSGENSEASAEGDDGVGAAVANASLLSEALSISSFTGTRARASLFVNLAMVHVMLNDFPQANHFAMQAASIIPANPIAVLCVVYVNLVQGRTEEAPVGVSEHGTCFLYHNWTGQDPMAILHTNVEPFTVFLLMYLGFGIVKEGWRNELQ